MLKTTSAFLLSLIFYIIISICFLFAYDMFVNRHHSISIPIAISLALLSASNLLFGLLVYYKFSPKTYLIVFGILSIIVPSLSIIIAAPTLLPEQIIGSRWATTMSVPDFCIYVITLLLTSFSYFYSFHFFAKLFKR